MDPDIEIINQYGVEPKLVSLYAKGGHAMICTCEDPSLVAKVELQQGPGKLALLRKEQEFMRDFKGVPGLAHSCDVYWNIPHPYLKDHVFNVMYTPFYPYRLEELKLTPYEVAVQLKAALDRLHDRGLVPRDINPGNIRGSSLKELVLIDFGLCAVTSRLYYSRPSKGAHFVATGTPPFISDSVQRGNMYTKNDDVESACKVICYLIDPDHWMTRPCPKEVEELFFGHRM